MTATTCTQSRQKPARIRARPELVPCKCEDALSIRLCMTGHAHGLSGTLWRMRLPDHLQHLALTRAGALTIRELDRAGIRSRQISAAVRDGHWQRATPAVVITHSLAIDRATELWVASLHFDGFALGGTSALEVDGFPTPSSGRIHLIGPRGGQKPPSTSWVLHTSTSHVAANAADRPSAVNSSMAVVQAMQWAVSDRQAVFVATWAIQQRLTSLEVLQTLCEHRPRNAGASRARRVAALLEPGVHSIHEFDFAQQCKRRGLPEPLRQRLRKDSSGSARYTDCEFVIDNRSLIVEIDGLGHLDTEVRVDDQWRANELTMQGATVLRVPAIVLRTNPEPFFAQLHRALSQLRAA